MILEKQRGTLRSFHFHFVTTYCICNNYNLITTLFREYIGTLHCEYFRTRTVIITNYWLQKFCSFLGVLSARRLILMPCYRDNVSPSLFPFAFQKAGTSGHSTKQRRLLGSIGIVRLRNLQINLFRYRWIHWPWIHWPTRRQRRQCSASCNGHRSSWISWLRSSRCSS